MVSYQYTYLIGDLIGLLGWLVLFIRRKDTRKEMLIFSLLFAVIAILTWPIYIQDWWQPLTATGTIFGIEDILFGFVIGGAAAVIYEHLFNKRVKIKKVKVSKEKKRNLKFIFIILLVAVLFGGSFLVFNLNTFISSVLAMIIPTLIIWIRRKDLVKDSILSGVFTLILAILVYQILNFLSPGFANQFWFYQNIGKIILFGIPLEEIIWFFLFGTLVGPLYEYWKEGKLINIKK